METNEAGLLERLEQQNLELAERLAAQAKSALSWRAGLLTLGLTALFTPFAAGIAIPSLLPEARVVNITARSFELRDAEGRMRAALMIGLHGQPVLAFYDEDAKNVMNVATGPDGTSGMSVIDRDGKPRITFGGLEGGSHGLLLFDEKQGRRAGLWLKRDGSSRLGFYDGYLRERGSSGIRPDGESYFHTLDEDGKVIFQTPKK